MLKGRGGEMERKTSAMDDLPGGQRSLWAGKRWVVREMIVSDRIFHVLFMLRGEREG